MGNEKHIGLVAEDEWLAPYEDAIRGRHDHAVWKINQLTGGSGSLSDFANGHAYFGLHRTQDGWVFRERAPHALDIFLIGDFNGWKESQRYRLQKVGTRAIGN